MQCNAVKSLALSRGRGWPVGGGGGEGAGESGVSRERRRGGRGGAIKRNVLALSQALSSSFSHSR